MFVINIFITMVNLEWYRTFKSVYKNGNFSLAAKELFISQPAVSQQIAMLEADKGIQIDIASPLGGQPPIDPKSADPASATEDTKRFDADTALLAKLKNTKKLSEVSPSDYDAVFYPGGHGPLWDLAENTTSSDLIATFYTQNKPVAFVCHAPAALKNVKVNGDFLVKGKKVTGFTNSEEAAVGLTNVVPFLVEDMLQKNGGSYSKAGDWQSYAVEDGLLVTGQNPASSKLVAEKLLAQLNAKK